MQLRGRRNGARVGSPSYVSEECEFLSIALRMSHCDYPKRENDTPPVLVLTTHFDFVGRNE